MDGIYTFTGKVIDGKKRGERLSFPTINIPLQQIVAEGIYISQTEIDQKKYKSLTFIGAAITYGETDYKSETYILDFSRNLYGQEVTITLLKKIRDNQKFASEAALSAQMEDDKKQAEEYFKNL